MFFQKSCSLNMLCFPHCFSAFTPPTGQIFIIFILLYRLSLLSGFSDSFNCVLLFVLWFIFLFLQVFPFYYINVFSYFLVLYNLFLSNPTCFYFHFFLSNMHLYCADLRRGIPADSPLFQAFQRFRRRMPVPVVFAAGNQDQLRLCQIQQCFSRRVGRAVVPGVEDGAAEGILCSGLV